ncbi:hypothetical protein OHC33_005300 [Knufia fluminis]|uniref:Nephrocystin 3-like N-terminal domain-containing protein n=1 Tax=Knufia fluminis TaxID=191047 RepID=A0AAN8ETH8_9EURO|nr:hypothetical protein OHC33_005300 [Knufia fluminis]
MAESQPKRRRLSHEFEDEPARYTQGGHYGNTTVAGHARVLLGNDNSVHHHYSHSTGDAASVASADDLKTLISSLTFDRWDDRIKNVYKPIPGTCTWLPKHEYFKAWIDSSKLDEHNGFLWIKGHPGCGKSTIMKNAVDYIRKRRTEYGTVISYFFNARATEELEKSSLGLYRSLTYQLLAAFPALGQRFRETFASKLRGQFMFEWNAVELQNFIIDAVQSLQSPLCIFIDALDEGQASDIRLMIEYLQDLASHARASGTMFRICLSSRHFPHITIGQGLSFDVEHLCEHDADITFYIKTKLKVDEPAQMSSLREQIEQKSAGIFLWVVLVVGMLNQIHDLGEGYNAMKKCLKQVPENLEGLFTDILVKNRTDLATCLVLLRWVLYGTRQLTPLELYTGIQHAKVSSTISDWRCCILHPHEINLPRYILNHSWGLVEVTATEPPTVQFIHETVREFFLGTKWSPQLEELFSLIQPGPSHENLKRACLDCISSVSADTSDIHEARLVPDAENADCVLVEYSTASLLKHVDAAQANGVLQNDFCQSLLVPNGADWRKYLLCRNRFEKHKTRKYGSDVQLLYVAAEQGLPYLANVLIESGIDVNTTGGRYSNALQVTCHFGHAEIAECLIAGGANVNAAGGEHKHALVAALLKKNFAIAELLINKGAILDGRLMDKTLKILVDRKVAQGVEMLLSLYSYAAVFDYTRRNAVVMEACAQLLFGFDLVAAWLGHEVLWQIFSDIHAVFSKHGYPIGAPHIAAAAIGRKECLELLLEASADVDQRTGMYGVALQAAVENGHIDIMALVIARGADVNAQNRVDVADRTWNNAIHAACFEGDLEAVELLLDHNADVNLRDFSGLTPLYHACGLHFRNLEIPTLLLTRGAEINATGAHLGTALCAACNHDNPGRVHLVKVLLEHGADIFLEGHLGCALVVAARNSSYEVVQMLAVEARKQDVDRSRLRSVFENAIRAAEEKLRPGPKNQEVVNLLREHLRAISSLSIDSLLLTSSSTG